MHQVEVLAVLHELLGDLQGQLARRLQDQAARHARLGPAIGQDIHHRQGEAGGLAGAGLGAAQHVAAHQHDRDGLFLDGRRRDVAGFCDSAQDRVGQAKIGEGDARRGVGFNLGVFRLGVFFRGFFLVIRPNGDVLGHSDSLGLGRGDVGLGLGRRFGGPVFGCFGQVRSIPSPGSGGVAAGQEARRADRRGAPAQTAGTCSRYPAHMPVARGKIKLGAGFYRDRRYA